MTIITSNYFHGLSSVLARIFTYVGRGGGGEQGVRFICPCPCAVSLLCAVLLANGEQQTDNGRRRTVVHWNVPTDNPSSKTQILCLLRVTKPSELDDSKRCLCLLRRLDREHVAPRVNLFICAWHAHE